MLLLSPQKQSQSHFLIKAVMILIGTEIVCFVKLVVKYDININNITVIIHISFYLQYTITKQLGRIINFFKTTKTFNLFFFFLPW